MRPRIYFDSLVLRLVVLGVVLVVIGVSMRLVTVMVSLREDIEAQAGAQQLAVARYIAADIGGKLESRRNLLNNLAHHIPLDLLEHPAELAHWLEDRHETFPLFANGLIVIASDSHRLIAEYPVLPGRNQVDFSEVKWYMAVRQSNRPAVGVPLVGRASRKPVLPIAAPVYDKQGRLAAVIAGLATLDAPGFLDAITDKKFGNIGDYLLVSPQERLFITGSDPNMVLHALPPQGETPWLDQAIGGFRGSGRSNTSSLTQDDEIYATASVPESEWFVIAKIPASEALQPVDRTRDSMLRNSLLIATIVITIIVFVLQHMFKPLRDAAIRMRQMADGSLDLQPLPIERTDEVGAMIAAFNRLVIRLHDKELTLIKRTRALERVLSELHDSGVRMSHMAHHDALTGLPNRALFEDRLQQALARSARFGRELALLFLDLDGFKPINDGYGHDIGDEALREVAARLAEVVRRADTVARFGGDEFVILLADLDDARSTAQTIAEKCLELIRPHLLINELRLSVGFSIGIAIHPADGESAATLVANADQAMYHAKQNGRGRYEFYRPESA